MAKPLKLDTAKFRKVRALMENGATEGERQAASSRALAIASKACMTLDAAIREDDRLLNLQPAAPAAAPPPAPTPGSTFRDIFEGFDDWMEEKEPGYKVRKAAERDERERQRAAERIDVLKVFGTEAALFQQQRHEAELFEAVQHLATFDTYTDHLGNTVKYTKKLCGQSIESHGDADDIPADVVGAVMQAFPYPAGLDDLLQEWRYWRKLERDRELFIDSEWYHFSEVTARVLLIERDLNSVPVASWSDMDARIDWWSIMSDRGWHDKDDDDRRRERIRADLAILQAQAIISPATVQNGHVQNGRRTNADKAAEVQAILASSPELSDRAIGRMAGVSPQTVSNWRSRLKAEASA